MKESYFTKESIDDKSSGMLNELRIQNDRRNIVFKPEKSALLIIDAQKYFLDKTSHAYIPSSFAIIPKIKNLLDVYTSMPFPVIMTQHINNEQSADMLAVWWGDLITKKDSMFEITPELHDKSAIIVEKAQYDAFYQTPLENILKEKGITQVVITGVMTNLCCETTARSAFVRGFSVFFTVDGTATYNEEFHKASLLNLSYGFATPVLCRELINHITETKNKNE
ncbi:isochorismatase family protein [Bacteroidota bacterium]